MPVEGCLLGRGEAVDGEPTLLNLDELPGGRTVSRRHAYLFLTEDVWQLRVEEESRNPVWVGDRRLLPGETVTLIDKSTVRLGEVQLVFQVDPEEDGYLVELPAPVIPVEAPSSPVAWAPLLGESIDIVKALGTEHIQRVQPFRGLMIDENVWADAHNYHRTVSQLHLLAGHGRGIVQGLEVVSDPSSPGTLIVRTGIAIDANGRLLVVPKEQRIPVDDLTDRVVYIALRLHEIPTAPQTPLGGQDQYTRTEEVGEAIVLLRPPVSPALELARVSVTGRIRNATNPAAPKMDEIDLRFRERLQVRPQPDLLVVQGLIEVDGDVADRHQFGLRYLLREIDAGSHYRARWGGAIPLASPLPTSAILYVAASGGFTLTDDELQQLRHFCSTGGVLWLDGCSDGSTGEFLDSAQALAVQLGRKPGKIERGHALLDTRYVFGLLPDAAQGDHQLLEDDGVVISTADFGCTWYGGTANNPVSREAIREALEVGVNAALYAVLRQHPLDIIDLG